MNLSSIEKECLMTGRKLRIKNEKATFIEKEETIKKDRTAGILRNLNIDVWSKGKWNDNSNHDTELGIDVIA